MERRLFLRNAAAGLAITPVLVQSGCAALSAGTSGKPLKGALLGTQYEGLETTGPEVQHPYFTDPAWEKAIPNYLEYNRVREDTNGRRSDEMILKHEPHLKLAGNRSDSMVDFVNPIKHPHVHNHWWSWIELWDGKTAPSVVNILAPKAGETLYGPDGIQFFAWLYAQKPFENDVIRIRAYCVTHGLFTKYETIG